MSRGSTSCPMRSPMAGRPACSTPDFARISRRLRPRPASPGRSAQVDLIVECGSVAQLMPRALDRALAAAGPRKPWVMTSPIRGNERAAADEVLRAHGLVQEVLPVPPFVHRRFEGPEEQARAIANARAAGHRTDGDRDDRPFPRAGPAGPPGGRGRPRRVVARAARGGAAALSAANRVNAPNHAVLPLCIASVSCRYRVGAPGPRGHDDRTARRLVKIFTIWLSAPRSERADFGWKS